MITTTARILVVDDESLPRLLLATSLREHGWEVVEADGGAAALQLLREGSVDVVLLDLVMPDMDGFRVLEQMKADKALASIPVVVVSGSDDMNSVVRCIEMGAVDHLSKPFDPLLLRTRVRAALALKQIEDEQGEEAVAGHSPEQADRPRPSLHTPGIAEPEQAETPQGMGLAAFAGRLLRWCRPYKRPMALLAVVLLVNLGLYAVLPLGFKFITDYGLVPHNLRVLLLVVLVLLTTAMLASVTDVAFDALYARVGTKLLNDLRFNMYRHLQRLSMRFYTRVSPSDIAARFTSDLAAVENTIMLCLPVVLGEAVLLLFSVILLFVLEWRLALLALLGLYVSYGGGRWMEPRASAATYRVKAQQAQITAALMENVQGQNVVKVFRLQGMMVERFKHLMVDFYHTAARAGFLTYLTQRLPDCSMMLCSSLTIGVGALMTYYDWLSIGDLIAFQVLLTELTSSLGELTWGVPNLLQAAVGMQRIDELLAEQPEVADAPDAVALGRPAREAALHGVRFGYVPGRLALNDVSLVIPAGHFVLLVGPSGCGKSTVLNLLMRFYDPQAGRVTIDGHDLRTVTQDSLRGQMSVVLQENFLFNTTVRENIRMGNRQAIDSEVEAAAQAAEMHEIIMGWPQRYDTVVGERGGQLSGGQRQRLALARALLSDPAILLLDEATSALDPETAAAINRTLLRLGKGRTIISVTHRLDMAPAVDGIFVFKEGRMVEQGRHEELVQSGGTYAQLWQKQSGLSMNADGCRAQVNTDRLRAIPILNPLGDTLLATLADLFVTEQHPQNRVVMREGDPGDRFYIIVRGRVAVSKTTAAGTEERLAVLDDGDHFGEVALLRRVPRVATVRTLTDCTLLSLAGEHFLRLLEANPQLREAMERALCDRSGTATV